MKKRKGRVEIDKKRIIGCLIMLIGLTLPFGVLSQMAYRHWKGRQEYQRFQEQQSQNSFPDTKLKEKIATYEAELGEEAGKFLDPFDTMEEAGSSSLLPEKEVFGYIRIPKIDLTKPIFLGASEEHLALGIAHLDGTHLFGDRPWSRTVLAGHRGFYQDLMFLNLNELEAGDLIYITTRLGENRVYEVKDKEVIAPENWRAVLPTSKETILTLLTCDPILPPSPSRLLVNCKLVEEEQTAIQEESTLQETSFSLGKMMYGIYLGMGILLLGYILVGVRLLKLFQRR